MLEILLLVLAGFGAGLVTGFFGGSATLVVVPVLVLFGGYHPYLAIGLALAIDVSSSIAAFLTYNIKKNIRIGPAIPLIVSALIGVVIGSFVSIRIPEKLLLLLAGTGMLIASIRFTLAHTKLMNGKRIFLRDGKLSSILWGFVNGIGLGVIGGGGGIVLLLGLTVLLRYPIHKAVGISVLGMVFIAFFGAVSHYVLMPFSILSLVIGSFAGVLGAISTSRFANKIPEKKFNIIIGGILTILATSLLVKGIFFI